MKNINDDIDNTNVNNNDNDNRKTNNINNIDCDERIYKVNSQIKQIMNTYNIS